MKNIIITLTESEADIMWEALYRFKERQEDRGEDTSDTQVVRRKLYDAMDAANWEEAQENAVEIAAVDNIGACFNSGAEFSRNPMSDVFTDELGRIATVTHVVNVNDMYFVDFGKFGKSKNYKTRENAFAALLKKGYRRLDTMIRDNKIAVYFAD